MEMRFRRCGAWLTLGGMLAVALVAWPQENEKAPFTPPTRAQQVAAVGSLDQMSPVARRAFEITDDFETIHAPGARDWLFSFPEKGQTFDTFFKSARNIPTANARTIYIQPLGGFPKDLSPDIHLLRDYCAAYFGLPIKVLPAVALAAGGKVRSRMQFGSLQFRTEDIFEVLKARLPADAFCVIGVTMEDLYPDERWNFVFGEASYTDRVGVFGFKRFTPSFNEEPWTEDSRRLLLRRSCDTLAHEIGHMFGLAHCTFFECVMCGSNHLAEADARPMHACPVCLRKLYSSVHFDLVARERALLAFYEMQGFKDEAERERKRLERLTAK